MQIRAATEADCPTLTNIVRESNAYTGEFRKIVETVQITPDHLRGEHFFVYKVEDAIGGFYSLLPKADGIELDFMFVDNAFLGRGIGRQMFQHMLITAREMGYAVVEIIAHPPAKAFYAKMGAETRGSIPPKDRVSWSRPHMWVNT